MTASLSRREMQVAKQIALGMGAVAIAQDLVGYEAVRYYLRQIRRKMAVYRRQDIRMFMTQAFTEEEELTLP